MSAPGSWRGWYLEKDSHVAPENKPYLLLRHETLSAGDYYIDLTTCNTSAQMLDWIFQLGFRGGGEPLLGLVQAFDDIFQPQANLCSGGKSKRLSKRKLRALVEAAHARTTT